MTNKNYGTLTDANTGEALRPAREDEWRISRKLARIGKANRGVFCYGRMEVYVDGGDELPEPVVSCRYCGTALRWTGHVYTDESGVRVCPRSDGISHAPEPLPAADVLDLVYGPDGADDALTTSLREAQKAGRR